MPATGHHRRDRRAPTRSRARPRPRSWPRTRARPTRAGPACTSTPAVTCSTSIASPAAVEQLVDVGRTGRRGKTEHSPVDLRQARPSAVEPAQPDGSRPRSSASSAGRRGASGAGLLRHGTAPHAGQADPGEPHPRSRPVTPVCEASSSQHEWCRYPRHTVGSVFRSPPRPRGPIMRSMARLEQLAVPLVGEA